MMWLRQGHCRASLKSKSEVLVDTFNTHDKEESQTKKI
jgi:hypothetical protein